MVDVNCDKSIRQPKYVVYYLNMIWKRKMKD